MKRLFFAIVSLFLLVLAGCEKEENMGILNSPDTLVATIEVAGDTKAQLQSGTGDVMNVVWQNYDPISVFYKIGDEVKNVKYVCNDGAGTTTGIFVKADNNTDVTGATLLAAVYPYTQEATYTEGTKVVSGLTMAASYEFSAQMIKTGTPMAYVGNGDRIVFKNAAALVKVTASNIPTGYTSVELSSATAKLSGNYTITFDNNGLPVAALTDENTNANTVTFTGTSENQTVYFPILPGTYTDLKVSAKGTSVEPLVLVAPKALTAARSNYYYTTVAVQSVSTQDALTDAINGAGTEDVNIAVDDNLNEVELPTTSEDKEVTITFSSTTENISVSQASGAEVAGNVNIAANNADGLTTRTLVVNLPKSTVEVIGDATYANITATTADHTLVLGSGITATKVTVKKGNIKVNAGATLNGIEFGTDATDVTSVTIIDNGGTIADEVRNNTNVTVISADEGELRKVVAKGGEMKLVSNLALTSPLKIPKGVTINLDLNGKTISQEKAQTGTYAMIANKGTLVIKDSDPNGNGKISYKDITEYSADNNYASNTIRNEGVLTLKSGTIENTSSDNVMNYGYPHAIDVYQGSTTNIEGGTVKSDNYDCIRMFCNSTTLATTVNISGGKIINRVTFQNPSSNQAGYGVLNITGGEFTITEGVTANVRLLNFSTDVSNMKAKISGGTFDKGVKTQSYSSWTKDWSWLTIENGVQITKLD